MVAIEHRQKSTTTAITTSTSSASSAEETTTTAATAAETTATAVVVAAVKSTTVSVQQQHLVEELKEKQQQLQKETIKRTQVEPTTTSTPTATTTTENTTKMSQQLNAGEGKRQDAATAAAAAATVKSAVSQRNVDIKIAKKSNKDEVSQELSKKVLKLDLTGKDLDEFSLKSPKSPITARLPHQTSLTSSVDVEDRKTLREALYQGIFHRHRRTIFAVGSFLRMLRSRNSQYNTIRSSSEGEEVDEVR